jgi:lysophospholipase L1-like esterase
LRDTTGDSKELDPSKPKRAASISRLKKCVFATVSTVFFFAVLEVTLRLVGFHFAPRTPDVVIDGKLVAPMFRHSKNAVWEPIPGVKGFNEDRFVGPRISVERTPTTIRIAAVGDSCTQFGDPPYSAVLRDLLADRLNKPVEVLNAGVAGYSTEQGRRRLECDVMPYRPDVVLLYFGWNDHWILDRFTDAEVAAENSRQWAWLDYAGWSRVVQLGLCVAHTVHERHAWELVHKPRVLRVPPEQYRQNLEKMIGISRRVRAKPILITAPTDMTGQTPVTDFTNLLYLEDTEYETPKALHDAYVNFTRDVAQKTGCRLADAEQLFKAKSGLIMRDHIHLTQSGIELMAEFLAGEVAGQLHTGHNAPHDSAQ